MGLAGMVVGTHEVAVQVVQTDPGGNVGRGTARRRVDRRVAQALALAAVGLESDAASVLIIEGLALELGEFADCAVAFSV